MVIFFDEVILNLKTEWLPNTPPATEFKPTHFSG